jgi:uncharacterized coiled-coil protein SlyX
MKMQQMLELLLALQEQMIAEMNANHEEMMAKMDAKTEAMRDKRMEANMNDDQKETMVCQDAMEANLEKMVPNSGEKESVAEHQEVHKEDAIVKPVKGRKERNRGQKLTAGRR